MTTCLSLSQDTERRSAFSILVSVKCQKCDRHSFNPIVSLYSFTFLIHPFFPFFFSFIPPITLLHSIRFSSISIPCIIIILLTICVSSSHSFHSLYFFLCFHLSWFQTPEDRYTFGKIRGYYIGYRPVSSSISSPLSSSGSNVANYVYKTVPIGIEPDQQRGSSVTYNNNNQNEAGTKTEAILKSLSRSTKYEIVVQSYNSKGAGPTSEPIFVETFQGGEFWSFESTCQIFTSFSVLFSQLKLCQNLIMIEIFIGWMKRLEGRESNSCAIIMPR